MDYDFSGWATRNDLKCADGRTIRKNAFKVNDGQKVPLVWSHVHDDPTTVIGHAVLKNNDDGVYAYCSLNDSDNARAVKEAIKHGDLTALSIYANGLKQKGSDVVHGMIREVSVVISGANPGALIDSVICHSSDGLDDEEYEAIICTGDEIILEHSGDKADQKPEEKDEEPKPAEEKKEEAKVADSEKTVQDVYDAMTEEQKTAVQVIVGLAVEEVKKEDNGGDADMKHNAFEADNFEQNDVLSHDAMTEIIKDGKRCGTLKESVLAHSADYGIEDIEYLFPEARNVTDKPEYIAREMDWVKKVLSGTHHVPFSRIKSMFADITEDQARAKGYIKGKLKKEEVFSLLKRSTAPTTIYKKQKLDRDDIIDITDFDVVAWIKSEMRIMLDEEIARAILIGDGRLTSDDDHINADNIRPIMNDADLFVIRWAVAGATGDDKAKNFIKAAIKSRKNYKGSGNPSLYTTEDMLTDMLLLEDGIGHKLYKTEQELATALRVKEIVTVPVMEGCKDKDTKDVLGIIVNLADYNVGADKGGSINMFEDFDIDYNQEKYLIETRCSGALVKPFSAIVLRSGANTESEEPTLAAAKQQLTA